MADKDLVDKYNQIAEGFSENSYANLPFDMERRFSLVISWGTKLERGDSIFELGCGDGYLACIFTQHGFRYCGMDISPKMVTIAQQRLQEAGWRGNFVTGDVNQFSLSESYDAIVAYMRNFFAYVKDPLAVLKMLLPYVQKKLIVDLDPRRGTTLKEAINILRAAGFRNIAWRPFFVPKDKRLPIRVLKTLVFWEEIPLVRTMPLRWKFNCLLKGEP